MLTQIYVKNFVLIDAVRLDFDSRMSVFTGETGAGKSLLIDAIAVSYTHLTLPTKLEV